MGNLIRISESNDFIVDYDKDRRMYRVSVFEDNHYQDEYWFDAYGEKEAANKIEKIIEKLEINKVNYKKMLLQRNQYMNGELIECYLNLLIDWIKDLSKSP